MEVEQTKFSFVNFVDKRRDRTNYFTFTKLQKNKKKDETTCTEIVTPSKNTNQERYGMIFLGHATTNSGRVIRHYRQKIAAIYRNTLVRGIRSRNEVACGFYENFLILVLNGV